MGRPDEENQTKNGPSAESQLLPPVSEPVHHTKPARPLPDVDEPGSKIWRPYLDLSDKYDKDLVETWRDDMESLLIFAALFSASVTAFVIESYHSLGQDSANLSVQLLFHMSQQLANTSMPAAPPLPSFVPNNESVAVNIFWFLSLAFSLACALGAVMIRQWARDYLRIPRSISSTSERARMRQYLFENIDWWKFELFVETIPLLMHISLILFFIGLLVFLHTVDSHLATYLTYFCTIGTAAYVMLTITPLVCPGCPYRTPLTRFLVLLVRAGWYFVINPISTLLATIIFSLYSNRIIFKLLRPVTIPAIYTWALRRVRRTTGNIKTFVWRIRGYKHTIAEKIRHVSALFRILRISGVEARRRRFATSECYVRDTNALHWVMAFSRHEADLVTTVDAIPDFIKGLAVVVPKTGEVGPGIYTAQSLLWKTGIVQRIPRLLESCLDGTMIDPTMRGTAQSCLEALHWLLRCPVVTSGGEGGPSLRLMPTQPAASTPQSDSDYRWLWLVTTIDHSDNVAPLYTCILYTFVLDQVYQVENTIRWYKARHSPMWFDEACSLLRGAMAAAGRSQRSFARSGPHDELRVSALLETKHNVVPDIELILLRFRDFRVRWATRMLSRMCSPESSSVWSIQDPIVFNSLCDAATHLPAYPRSTTESQLAIFRFLHTTLKGRRGNGQPVQFIIPQRIFEVYGQVLHGEQAHIIVANIFPLHRNFFDRVQVRGKEELRPFNASSEDIHVNINVYCAILEKLTLSVDTEVDREDAQALVICDFLQYRSPSTQIQRNPFVVTVEHLRVVRKLLENPRHRILHDLCLRTAKRFGYHSQLNPDDIHAELDYYDLD